MMKGGGCKKSKREKKKRNETKIVCFPSDQIYGDNTLKSM